MTTGAPRAVAVRLALPGAAAVAIAAGCELAGRSIARASTIGALTGVVPSPATVAATAGAAALAALVVLWLARALTATRVMATVLVASFPAGMAAQLALGARLQSDGFYYFAHLRSLWFDGDQDLTNDYRLLGLGDKAHLFTPTPTGYAQSAWTIGPSMVWAPMFAVGDVVAHGLRARGAEVAVDGTSFPYRQAVCVAGLVWGLAGLFWCYLLASRLAPRGWAAAATVLIGAGTFILWYLVKEPTMTHAPSMALVALFTWQWLETRGARSRRQWVLLGLLAGFMATVRWQNALFALLPAIEWLATAWRMRAAGDGRAMTAHVGAGVIFTAAAVVGFIPQMLSWQAIYGHLLAVSPLGPQIRWWHPRLVDALWSSRNGLLATSPVLIVGLVGLVLAWRRDRLFAGAALAMVGLMLYFNASIQDWWGSAAFGARRFDGTLPLFVAGTAIALELGARGLARRPEIGLALAGGVLIAWNLTFMSAALDGVVRLGEPVAFAPLAGRQAGQVERWIGHPGSWPVNLLFAVRNGVSPADYDLLWPLRFLSDPNQPYGRIDLGRNDEVWLGDGWNDPESAGAARFRWATRAASLRLVLDHTAPLITQVRVHALAFRGAPPQQLTLVVNGARQPPQMVPDDWAVLAQPVPAGAWRTGMNTLTLVFSRADRPSDLGLSGDSRVLAAAVEYVRVEVEAR